MNRGSAGNRGRGQLPSNQHGQVYEDATSEDRIRTMYFTPTTSGIEASSTRNDTRDRRQSSSNSSKNIVPPLFLYIEAGDFRKATERAARHPREVQMWGSNKISKSNSSASGDDKQSESTQRLPLHHACMKVSEAGAIALQTEHTIISFFCLVLLYASLVFWFQTNDTIPSKTLFLYIHTPGTTTKTRSQMLFDAVGKEPNFFFAPLWLFDVIIDSLQWVADTFESEKFENAAETGRIGKYYAVEDMLTTKPDEKFGTITLQEHYDRIAVEGQEYDPYTTMFAKAPE